MGTFPHAGPASALAPGCAPRVRDLRTPMGMQRSPSVVSEATEDPSAVLPAVPSVRAYAELAPSPPDGSVDLTALVPGEGPLELDVGFGRGLSLFERAAAVPGRRLLGLEVRAKWVCQVESRRRREGLASMRVLLADARDLLGRSGPDGTVARVFVHFPDPWWKKRHRKRRVVDAQFVAQVARLLEPGGDLYVQTDVPERADLYEGLMRDEPAFDAVSRLDHNPFGGRSNREVRAEADGLPVYRLLATRSSAQ
jgi:tRNA (guanine-N7-)-methyltransferase